MRWDALLAPEFFTVLLAALLMLALAGWLLALDFNARIHRALALFLGARAMTMGTTALGFVLGDYWQRLSIWFDLATAPALAWFLLAYLAPGARLTRRWHGRAALAGLAAALWVAYALDPCLRRCRDASGAVAIGPLDVLSTYLLLSLAALAVAWRWRAQPAGHARTSSLLVLSAFALNGIFDGVTGLAYLLPERAVGAPLAGPWAAPFLAARVLTGVPAVVALAIVLRHDAGPAAARRNARLVAGAALAALSGAFVAAAFFGLVPGLPQEPAVLVIGLWRAAIPALLAYAILRHRLFDLDVQLRVGVSRATVAVVFLGAFVVAREIAESYVSATYGWAAGGVATLALVGAVQPLRRVADRFARAWMPEAKGLAELSRQEVRELYLDQARLAWGDGAVQPEERVLLDRLRVQLSLDPAEAERLEHAARGLRPAAHPKD